MSKQAHSALPWQFTYGAIYSPEQGRIALADRDNPNTSPCERDDDCRYIVRACNAHEALVSALRAAEQALIGLLQYGDEPGDMPEPLLEQISDALDLAREK